MTQLHEAIANVRVEWLVLQAVVQAEIKSGETIALDHQMARFEEAVDAIEQAMRRSVVADIYEGELSA